MLLQRHSPENKLSTELTPCFLFCQFSPKIQSWYLHLTIKLFVSNYNYAEIWQQVTLQCGKLAICIMLHKIVMTHKQNVLFGVFVCCGFHESDLLPNQMYRGKLCCFII